MDEPAFGFGPDEEGQPEGQVMRWKTFEARHPYITITPPGPGGKWRASESGRKITSALELRHLLDELEVLEGWFDRPRDADMTTLEDEAARMQCPSVL